MFERMRIIELSDRDIALLSIMAIGTMALMGAVTTPLLGQAWGIAGAFACDSVSCAVAFTAVGAWHGFIYGAAVGVASGPGAIASAAVGSALGL